MNYKNLKNKLKGPIFSIITPFKNNGKDIDYDSLGKYIQFLYNNGARIFYAMAFNTRYLLMNNAEIFEINEFIIKTVKSLDKNNIVIVGDPLHCSTDTSIEFAKHAKKHGADIVSLIYRSYLFFDDHVYNHYKKIADSVDIGILVHEMPFAKGIPDHQDGKWSLSLLDKLADIPQIVAIKEDAKDNQYSRMVVDKIYDRVAVVISGNGLQQWSKVADKCSAWLTGISCFVPRSEIDFYNYYLNNNKEKCNEIIEHLEKPFFWIKDNLSWHLGIKSTLHLLGLMDRQERMPYQMLNKTQHQQVKDILIKISEFKSNQKYIQKKDIK